MATTQTTAPDILKDARQLYAAHRSTATKPTKVENLDKVWGVLNAIRDDGGRDYSLAEVGRRLEAVGGPKTQSLRNAQGAHYREIITAYADAVSGSTRYVPKTKANVDQALELITDPSIRATLRVALDNAKRLKVVNDNLHAAFKSLQVGAVLHRLTVESEPSVSAADQGATAASLSQRYVIALRKGIDETRLAQQGLQVAQDGSIQSEQGDMLFPPAFVDAIRSILSNIQA
ncbi:hypothetical protein DR64_5398 [Paraburkholderia xenovorans LB400]|uniref:Uncharacterized protein n=1 Tax=Paraburkholderia xenovorans (strain LB400) TaxID=266265 RepID=Q13J47_PARXL|nr:gamma-mobile-trio protein GmtX [Paraburkholderia xenovorans]ABE35892.1 hypothetical protein Bxe_B0034 [Paraburkholderia xenovorans LB400]AIP36644.1 hypothetical protein DR64_5398 [Paraburkholderia xenovorans LB400]